MNASAPPMLNTIQPRPTKKILIGRATYLYYGIIHPLIAMHPRPTARPRAG